MFWLLIAILCLAVGIGFLAAGRKCLQKDRPCNRRSMSAVTRILYAAGFTGLGCACYTVYFWFEDEVFDRRWELLEVIFIICTGVALVWVVIALIYLIAGPLYLSRAKRAAAAAAQVTAAPKTKQEPAARVCGFCGERAEDGLVYCAKCGHRL